VRPRNPARQAAKYRREGLRALAVLLEEAGRRVLESGKSERVAGGVLRLAKRKGRYIRDFDGGSVWLDAEQRLVWTGPRMPAKSTETARQCKSDVEMEAGHG